MSKTLDVVLLLALPASGKSEVRAFLRSLEPQECRDEFHIGSTLQLDDYPYVHFMHRIDDELRQRGMPYVFYKGPDRPFQDNREWQTLIELLNEDFDDLMNHRTFNPQSAANLLFDRLDMARSNAGLEPALGQIPYIIRMDMAEAMEEECRDDLEMRNKQAGVDLEGKTIFIEAARGGPHGAAFPLTPPHGYQFAFECFSEEILDRASILYIWVTPEDSRRKNIERGIPGEQASILHHSVPMEVMLGEYGCDDMDYLIKQSEVDDTIATGRIIQTVNDEGELRYSYKTWNIPVAKFDNRGDLTSFIREKKWADEDVRKMRHELRRALATLSSLQK